MTEWSKERFEFEFENIMNIISLIGENNQYSLLYNLYILELISVFHYINISNQRFD